MDFSKLKAFMDHLTAWRIPGNDISVWLENKEVFRYQSGYMDVENKKPMSPDCLLNIYSCSKVATVVSGLQLMEKGKFLLDTPVYDFLPEYRNLYINGENGALVPAKETMTMRHLFTMTAGLSYSLSDDLRKEAEEKTGGKFNTVEVARIMAKMPLSFEPGTKWQYSFCHDVLAAVVETISGLKFRDYVQKNIAQPLGMVETYFHECPSIQNKIAPQYNFVADVQNGEEIKPAGYTQSVDMSKCGGHLERKEGNTLVFGAEYDSGGAGIITSVSDYGKFANALANEGLGATGERILSSSSVRLLKQNQLSDSQKISFNWSQLAGYGYGLGVRTMVNPAQGGSLSSVGEFGWGGAAGASMFVDTERKLGVFYAHHMRNQQEAYYQPRLRNVLYSCID